jgi:hypothetical protein
MHDTGGLVARGVVKIEHLHLNSVNFHHQGISLINYYNNSTPIEVPFQLVHENNMQLV